jgi:hypothetical protein
MKTRWNEDQDEGNCSEAVTHNGPEHLVPFHNPFAKGFVFPFLFRSFLRAAFACLAYRWSAGFCGILAAGLQPVQFYLHR